MEFCKTQSNILSPIRGILDNADGIMLTGSYATGENMHNSDIDIVILSRKINYIYCESLNLSRKTIQIIFFPYFKGQFALIDDTFKGKGIYTSMFRKGNIIKDNSNAMLTRMQKYIYGCEEHRNQQEKLTLIYKISNNLESLSEDTPVLEKLYMASEVLLDISKLLTHSYKVDGKHNARNIVSDKIDKTS